MGLRRMLISGPFMQRLLTKGVGPTRPINVPADIEFVYVRLNTLNDTIECIVRSKAFEGGSLRCACERCMREGLQYLPIFIATFRDARVEDAETVA